MAQAILLEASLSFLGLGRDGADAGLGPDAVGHVGRFLPDGAVDDPVPGPRHHARRVRLQPVRRQPARLARSEAEELRDRLSGVRCQRPETRSAHLEA